MHPDADPVPLDEGVHESEVQQGDSIANLLQLMTGEGREHHRRGEGLGPNGTEAGDRHHNSALWKVNAADKTMQGADGMIVSGSDALTDGETDTPPGMQAERQPVPQTTAGKCVH